MPEIVEYGKDWHLLSDIGSPLNRLLKRSSPDEALELAQRALRAIRSLHRNGGYLSQAFARNICVSESGIGFIDFEDDPREVYSLEEAQARDLLLAISSMCGHFERDMPRFAEISMRLIDEYPEKVRRPLLENIAALGRFRRIYRIFSRVREVRRIGLMASHLSQPA